MKFVSSAIFDNQVLKIHSIKDIIKHTVLVQDWNDVIEVLEAAYNFSQKKLIISKR